IQMELYVWDYAASQWSNGAGVMGENQYADNAAQNRDVILTHSIRQNVERYLGDDGRLTFLVYGERSSQESMHDYVSVTVTSGVPSEPVPAVSFWGVIATALMVLTGGTIVFATMRVGRQPA
ncbi:MAG: hypothetical protein ACPGXK_14625, partial [Phycisphaerae bacterium]